MDSLVVTFRRDTVPVLCLGIAGVVLGVGLALVAAAAAGGPVNGPKQTVGLFAIAIVLIGLGVLAIRYFVRWRRSFLAVNAWGIVLRDGTGLVEVPWTRIAWVQLVVVRGSRGRPNTSLRLAAPLARTDLVRFADRQLPEPYTHRMGLLPASSAQRMPDIVQAMDRFANGRYAGLVEITGGHERRPPRDREPCNRSTSPMPGTHRNSWASPSSSS